MKLKEVSHEEEWGNKVFKKPFNFRNNRFELFDKDGFELNSWSMENVPNVLELEVLEIKISGYSGYGVGFPVTHIRLNYINNNIRVMPPMGIMFGDYDIRP